MVWKISVFGRFMFLIVLSMDYKKVINPIVFFVYLSYF